MVYVKIDPLQLRSELRHQVAEIIFDKHDGSRRVMIATLKGRLLPEGYDPESDVPVTNILRVWDVQANGWRSVDTNRVISCQIVGGYD